MSNILYCNITLNIEQGLSFVSGEFVQLIHDIDNYISGQIVSYNVNNGEIVIRPISYKSTSEGCLTGWTVVISGPSGDDCGKCEVSGTSNTIAKFVSDDEIGDTETPIYEYNGNTILIGIDTPTTSNAIFEIYGQRGFMMPRLTESQRNGLNASPLIDTGLMVYQIDGDEGVYIYKAAGWVQII